MTDHKSGDDYAGMASVYDAFLEPFLRPSRLALKRLVQELGAQQVLDLGCGTGMQLSRLQDTGVQAWGVDLSTGMLAQARRQAPQRCLRADATQTPFFDASFDLVYCQYALHEKSRHVIAGVLSEAKRLLKPGGHLVITDYAPSPDKRPWTSTLAIGIRAIERFAGDQHYRHYRDWMSRDGLDAVLSEAGWTRLHGQKFFRGNVRMDVFKA